jgi:AAA+ superfamily predicted ATPase
MAESLAEHVELPLRPINLSNLISVGGGTDVNQISRVFNEAKRLDTILLIDEADVVLEKRALEDVHRNAIVSGKLKSFSVKANVHLTISRQLSSENWSISPEYCF